VWAGPCSWPDQKGRSASVIAGASQTMQLMSVSRWQVSMWRIVQPWALSAALSSCASMAVATVLFERCVMSMFPFCISPIADEQRKGRAS
jgi:hypothetical protein